MRGIADTAYAMREVAHRNAPFNWRTGALVWGCFEAHLVSTISLLSFIFLPMFYSLMSLIHDQHKVFTFHEHKLQRDIVDNMGRVNLVLMIVVLICFEVGRATCRRHLYGLRSPSIPRTPHGAALHVLSYIWLFLGVYFYTILPMLVVITKHALNIKSTNYVVAAKKAQEGPAATATVTANTGGAKAPGADNTVEITVAAR